MMNYGITLPEFWTGETGQTLRRQGGSDAQVLGLYLCSNRWANMLGLYRLMASDVSVETGLGLPLVARAFQVLTQVNFAEFDTGSSCVWVRTMARVRLNLRADQVLAHGDKRVQACNRIYQDLPANPFLGRFFDAYSSVLQLITQRKGFGEVLVMPLEDAPSEGASHAPSKGASRGASKAPSRGASRGASKGASVTPSPSPLVRASDAPSEGASEGACQGACEGPSEARSVPDQYVPVQKQYVPDQYVPRTDQEQEQEQDQISCATTEKRVVAQREVPIRDAFQRYFDGFEALYHAKPALDREKDAARMKRLIADAEGGLATVLARLDAFFDPRGDPFWAKCRHGLDVFFSSATQTKLIAFMSGVPESLMSDTMRHNLASAEEFQRQHGVRK